MTNKYDLVDKKFTELQSDADIMRDGPLDVDRYSSAKIKILWLLKQEYYDSGAAEKAYSKRVKECIQEGGIRSSPTWRKMAYVSYGILTGERDFSSFPDANECADHIFETAVIEANKEFGESGSKSPDSVIAEGFKRYEELIHLQLEAYRPDIIIACLPESLRCVVDSLYSHYHNKPFENGLKNIYIEGADVGISKNFEPLILWPYHLSATKGYHGKGITDYAYTMSLLEAYDSVLKAKK